MSSGFRLDDLSIDGRSWAGDETWFRVHPPGIAFDVGRGTHRLAGCGTVFLTHGHLDHALGVPFLLSQRSLHRASPTRVFCPASLVSPLSVLVDAAAAMENAEYQYQIVPLRPGDRVELSKDMIVEAFAADHVVPALGFHLLRLKRRLVSDLQGASPAELVDLKREGQSIEEIEEQTWLSYLGDSGPGVFDSEPDLFRSRVLLMECTFLADEMRDRGRQYGHMHFDDIVERASEFRNEALVLHHLSRRHKESELRALVDERLPDLVPQVHLLTGERR